MASARRHNAEAARIPAARADALVAMAETMLAHGPTARDGGERYQVVVTVAHDTLAGVAGVGAIDDGPFLISEAARRLACDSTVVAMSLGDGGEPLNVGRATQTIPRHIRRALRKRDGGCRFPGCGRRRFVDGHHIVHWGHGGETSLANTCLLCRYHHHAVHEGGFGLRRTPAGELVFTTPAGVELQAAPEVEPVRLDVDDVNHRLGVVIGSATEQFPRGSQLRRRRTWAWRPRRLGAPELGRRDRTDVQPHLDHHLHVGHADLQCRAQ